MTDNAARHIPAPLIWCGLWLVLVGTALFSRPIMPIDETRYLAVAWEMWNRGDFLVPHLNGATYSHKPPLLFWLINAGWAIFGVNEIWPRLVAPLFGLACLFVTRSLARHIWPERKIVEELAPLLLIGGMLWAPFTTLTMFDLILAFFTLVGIVGVIEAWRGRTLAGFGILGVAIGLGVLTKGPAILLHTLPVALLAPLWGPRLPQSGSIGNKPAVSWLRWYAGIFASLLLGTAIGLAWALPAAEAGGPAYADAIFWGQSAGRVVDSFAHGRPWWWYLAALPIMALPWFLWPRLWLAARGIKKLVGTGSGLLLAAWTVPALIVFSAISGKQPHYLLPEFPALALFAAALLDHNGDTVRRPRLDLALPASIFVLFGLALLGTSIVPFDLPEQVGWLQPQWGLVPIVAAAIILMQPPAGTLRSALVISLLAVLSVSAGHLAIRPVLSETFDLTPAGRRLGAWQEAGRPLANYGKYHGQFHFLGRLTQPIAVIGDGEAKKWLAENPNGKIVTYQSRLPDTDGPDMVLRFRGKWLVIWDAAKASPNPDVLKRE
jgi:4-amino-4-deoxy-L-arabinose transferase-like glycosyltransferase